MSKIKDCICSRFGEEGVIIEADFSQLEVIVLAFNSGDMQLRADLEAGIDTHSLGASFIYGVDYNTIKSAVDAGDKDWIKKRKSSKGPNFLIVYGGGAAAMVAQEPTLTMKQCKQFITNYYDRYPDVKRWQDKNIESVRLSRTPSSLKTDNGFPAGKGYLRTKTGRFYIFREYDAPDFMVNRGIHTSFSPTQIKNYPNQGLATGDIVPECCGRLFRAILHNKDVNLINKLLLTNTVHDSILADCHIDVLENSIKLIRDTLENAPKWIEKRWGFKFDFNLPVDIEVGPNWGNMEKI